MNLNENCTYPELREEVLRWDRAHQKWNNLLQFSHDTTGGSNNNDTVPMEIDRIEGRGRGKGGKGKSKTDKGNAKGKSKSKRKDTGKGENSSYDGGGKSGKGKSVPNQGKKGGKGDKSCYVCGKCGHYARDCCRNQSDRNVQNVSHGGQGQPDQGQNSSQHSGQQPQTQQPPPNRATQYRVSRISELNEHAEADQEQFVFDLRLSLPTSPNSNVSSVRALRLYLGDDEDEVSNQHGDVRAVVNEMPDEGDMHSILLDSGADAAVFPSSFARSGQKASGEVAKLHDAQGRIIPVEDMRDVEVKLMDQSGKLITLRERVAISSQVHQPILCYGKMLEAGWGIDPCEQTLVHSAGVKVPIELQNKSMVVKGWISVTNEASNETDMQQPASICAVKADVTPDLRLGPTGWNLDERNCGVGRHHASCFQDPTLVRPQMRQSCSNNPST